MAWDRRRSPAVAGLGLLGLFGITYSLVVGRGFRTQTEYKPVFEDLLFHVLLPLGAHVTLAVSAFAALSHLREALFGIGAAALLLPFVGIRNAWDGVAYRLFTKKF